MKTIKNFIEILFDKTVDLIIMFVIFILMTLPAVIYIGLIISNVIKIKLVALIIMIVITVIWALSVIETYEKR